VVVVALGVVVVEPLPLELPPLLSWSPPQPTTATIIAAAAHKRMNRAFIADLDAQLRACLY
jgi:hypothetical protein